MVCILPFHYQPIMKYWKSYLSTNGIVSICMGDTDHLRQATLSHISHYNNGASIVPPSPLWPMDMTIFNVPSTLMLLICLIRPFFPIIILEVSLAYVRWVMSCLHRLSLCRWYLLAMLSVSGAMDEGSIVHNFLRSVSRCPMHKPPCNLHIKDLSTYLLSMWLLVLWHHI